jgi:hypothetical protein
LTASRRAAHALTRHAKMTDTKRMLVDLLNVPTLAITMQGAFSALAPRYGVRLEGIEDDINEHMDFWTQVAVEMLKDERHATGLAPSAPHTR